MPGFRAARGIAKGRCDILAGCLSRKRGRRGRAPLVVLVAGSVGIAGLGPRRRRHQSSQEEDRAGGNGSNLGLMAGNGGLEGRHIALLDHGRDIARVRKQAGRCRGRLSDHVYALRSPRGSTAKMGGERCEPGSCDGRGGKGRYAAHCDGQDDASRRHLHPRPHSRSLRDAPGNPLWMMLRWTFDII